MGAIKEQVAKESRRNIKIRLELDPQDAYLLHEILSKDFVRAWLDKWIDEERSYELRQYISATLVEELYYRGVYATGRGNTLMFTIHAG